jgi:hypothetical protein
MLVIQWEDEGNTLDYEARFQPNPRFSRETEGDRRWKADKGKPYEKWRIFGPNTSKELADLFCTATHSTPDPVEDQSIGHRDCRIAAIAPGNLWAFRRDNKPLIMLESSYNKLWEQQATDRTYTNKQGLCGETRLQVRDGWHYPAENGRHHRGSRSTTVTQPTTVIAQPQHCKSWKHHDRIRQKHAPGASSRSTTLGQAYDPRRRTMPVDHTQLRLTAPMGANHRTTSSCYNSGDDTPHNASQHHDVTE